MTESIQAESLTETAQPPFQDSPARWWVRGTAVGMLIMAAVNAGSYFVRSADWNGLVSRSMSSQESLGFPWVIWENGNTYGGMFVDYPNLGLNILFAFGVSAFVGLWAARRSDRFNDLIQALQRQGGSREHPPIQFSLRGLMVATAIIAIVAMLARNYAARPETLIAIYAFGPLVLVVIAMLPSRVSWQKRVMIIVPATFALIAVAIVVGVALGMEFDKVMMGIFLCWTPQSVMAAVGLTAWVLYGEAKNGSSTLADAEDPLLASSQSEPITHSLSHTLARLLPELRFGTPVPR